MAFANLIQNNFNGGEISPLLYARNDLIAYANGLSECLNFIPRIQGAVTRRTGSYFVKEVKASTNKTALASFSFAKSKFILEFGHEYIRFYKDRQPFIVGGSHYEIASPYDKDDLFDADGVFLLNFAQSADVIYIAHANYKLRKLKHNADDNWTIETVDLAWGPYDTVNQSATTIYASATTGSVTLTASAGIFQSFDVGNELYLEQTPNTTMAVWQVDKDFALNTLVKSGGRYYKAVSLTSGSAFTGTHKSGTVIPSHTQGIASDGTIDWEYLHSSYGYATITGYTSATQVTATVNSRLPDNIVGSGNASTKWAFGALNTITGFAELVGFYKDRLVLAKGVNVYFSVVGDYENFALRDGPDLAVDMGISISVLAKEYNGLQWLYPFGDNLLIGTSSSVHLIGSSTSNQIFSNQNIASQNIIGRGCSRVPSYQIDSFLMIVQKSKEVLFGINNAEGYPMSDFSYVSDHLFDGGVIQLAYQERPDSILWVLKKDGSLLGFTFNESQEIKGWHKHTIAGGGVVESIATVASPDGSTDDLIMIVKRVIGGNTKRYVEYISDYFDYNLEIENAHYVDSGVFYNGSATSTITGLSHLNGLAVDILADGAIVPPQVVSGGQITLPKNASKVHVGLAFTSRIKTLSFEGGGEKGVTNSKPKRINKIQVKVFKSSYGQVAYANNGFEKFLHRGGDVPMGSPTPLYTGTFDLDIGNSYEREAVLTIKQEQPFPMTILAIMPEMVSYGS